MIIAATRGILAEGRTEMEGSFIREAWGWRQGSFIKLSPPPRLQGEDGGSR